MQMARPLLKGTQGMCLNPVRQPVRIGAPIPVRVPRLHARRSAASVRASAGGEQQPQQTTRDKPEAPKSAPQRQGSTGTPAPSTSGSSSGSSEWLARFTIGVQRRWEALDDKQKVGAVAAGVAAAFVVPKFAGLAILGVERVLIAGLLAAEEVLLQLLLRGGFVLAAIGALAAVGYVLYSFGPFADRGGKR